MPKQQIPRSTSSSSTARRRALFTNTKMGSIGSSVTQLGSVLTDITVNAIEKRNKVVENDYITNALVDSAEKGTRLQKSMLETRPDIKGFADDYIRDYDEIIKDKIDNAPTENAKRVLKNSLAQNRISNFKRAFDIENKQISDNILEKSHTNIEIIAERVFDNPELFQENLGQIDMIVENASLVLDDSNLAKFKEQAKLQIADRYIAGLMDKDIEKAKTIVGSDKFKNLVGSKLAKSYQNSVKVEENRITNEAKRNIQERREGVKVNREVGIFKEEVTQAQLDKDLDQGLYGNKEWLSLSKKLKESLNRQDSVAKSISNISGSLQSGQPFDTSSASVKKDLDRYYENVTIPNNQTLIPQQLVNRTSSFINNFGYIPTKLKSALIGNLINGSDKSVIESSASIKSLINTNPQLSRQFTNKELTRAIKVSDGINAGMTNENAVKAADTLLVEKNTAEFKDREKDFKTTSKEFDQDEITSLFVNDPNTVPQAMLSEWNLLYKSYVVDNKMSDEAGRDLAYKRIESQWGVSTATGEEKYMKRAPELYYNQKGLDPVWIEEQLKSDVGNLVPDTGDITLQADPGTENTDRPLYQVHYLNKNGIPLILRDKNGDILGWKPDIETSQNAKDQVSESVESFEKRRGFLEEIEKRRFPLKQEFLREEIE